MIGILIIIVNISITIIITMTITITIMTQKWPKIPFKNNQEGNDSTYFWESKEPLCKLLASPLISPIVVPYIIPYITPPLRSLDYSSYGNLIQLLQSGGST